MSLSERLVEAALALPGLDPLADALSGAVRGAYGALGPAGPPLKDALNGTWLGHPLHPAITDVPVGAWTAMLAFDLLGQPGPAKVALGVGLLGAAGAAVSGLTDWVDTYGRPRRLGVVHATMNVAATALCAVSFAIRDRDPRLGVRLSTAGYALAGISAMYGGALSLDMQIGVNRAHGADPPEDEVDGGALAEVPDGGMRRIDAGGYPVVVFRRGDSVHALAATCAHQGGPLDEGTYDAQNGTVTCPWHASVFCVSDGTVVHGPSAYVQPAFTASVEEGRIRLRISRR